MTLGIEALPVEVVHLIAAGEVIDSLAAVVRELAENALDAGATRIYVCVDPVQWRVRMVDNGRGIGLDDLKNAASPHSTSKIRDRQDLWNIRSLGFRGEALHSLAQLAQLQIASCSIQPTVNVGDTNGLGSQSEGWSITYDHQGHPIQVAPIAIAPGTLVIVDQLFATMPSRRQALPSPAQQLRAIQAMINRIAVCHPHVTWQVEQDESDSETRRRDREWFTLFPGASTQQMLAQILRDVQVSDLQELSVILEPFTEAAENSPSPPPELYLLLGLPDRCHRRRPDWVRVAVNGRVVNQPELEQTILASFRRIVPRDRYPVCFIHLRVPPDQLDWNRHPAKSEIYLHHLSVWQNHVAAAIDRALRLNPASLPETLLSQRLGKVLKTAEATEHYGLRENGLREKPDPERAQTAINGQDNAQVEEKSSPVPPLASSLTAIAQLHDRYILAEHPTGIWLIEQHIAHERVLYEQLCDYWQIVPLPTPIILNSLTAAQVEQLQRLTLEIDAFGAQTWVVRSAPAPLVPRNDCAEALLELSLGGDLQTAQVATACRTALRNGTPLTRAAMQTLLDQWQQTRNPRTCPHGRPICLTLEESSLSRFFRRHWVIGKSHGI